MVSPRVMRVVAWNVPQLSIALVGAIYTVRHLRDADLVHQATSSALLCLWCLVFALPSLLLPRVAVRALYGIHGNAIKPWRWLAAINLVVAAFNVYAIGQDLYGW
jgi:hypothetical protein